MRPIHQKLHRHDQPNHETRHHHARGPGFERHEAEEGHEGQRGDEHAQGGDARGEGEEEVRAVEVACAGLRLGVD